MKKITGKYCKIVMLLLLIVFGLQLVAGAKSSRPIVGFSGTGSLDAMYDIGQPGTPYDIHVTPGEEIRIPLTADMFEWESGRGTIPREAVTMTELRRGKVTVRSKVRSASEVLDYVQLSTDVFSGQPFLVQGENRPTGKTAYISVEFSKKLLSVDEVPFVIDIELRANGDTHENYRITLEGVMHNEEIAVTNNTDFVKINDNMVAVADHNISNVKFDLGNGVTTTKNVVKDQKYYGFSAVVDNMDIIREAYPDVHEVVSAVYKVETINMRYTNSHVNIKPKLNPKYPDVTDFFVYNEDLEYLGKTNEDLPYSDLYVLTVEELPTMDEASYLESLKNPPTQERA